MTDTQMVLVPLVANEDMLLDMFSDHDDPTEMLRDRRAVEHYLDLYSMAIQASPNAGKVTPEMVENIVFNMRKIAIENDLEKHKRLYGSCQDTLWRIENDLRSNKDFNSLMERMVQSVLKTTGLEVQGE